MSREADLEVGIVGLGTIGGNLAEQAVEENIRVVGTDVQERPELREMGVEVVESTTAAAPSGRRTL